MARLVSRPSADLRPAPICSYPHYVNSNKGLARLTLFRRQTLAPRQRTPGHAVALHGYSAPSAPTPRRPALECRAVAQDDFDVDPVQRMGGGRGGERFHLWGVLLARLAVLGRILNRLLCCVLPGPARFLPSLLVPLSAALAALGASYGGSAWLLLTSYMVGLSKKVTVLQSVTPLLQYDVWLLLVPVVLSLSGGIFTFVLIPALDLLLGAEENEDAQRVPRLIAGPAVYRGVLYAYAALHFVLLFGACYLVSTAALPPLAFLGLVISMGCEGGLVFTASHELLHSASRVDRLLASALLSSMGYMHWTVSHLAHHQKVATYEDPATARRNESLYSFLPRTIAGNMRDALHMERQRRRQYGVPTISVHNRVLCWVASPLLLAAGVFALFGGPGLTLLVGQAATGILLLEVVNYVEHYGLQRRVLPSGRYERVNERHSWNANSLFSNTVLFRLQRHTDHHMHSNKPYQLLCDIPSAPQLPWSYSVMMLLSTIPPLYFAVMNPLVDAERAALPAPAPQGVAGVN